MSFFQKMGNAFSRFMYGRNGVDSLGWASLVAVLLLDTAELIVRSKNETARTILATASFLLMVWTLFRMFSRNFSKRNQENERYMTYQNKVTGFFKKQKNLFEQRKIYHIYTCPSCKQKIRIPKGKGKIQVTCPKCHTQFIKKS